MCLRKALGPPDPPIHPGGSSHEPVSSLLCKYHISPVPGDGLELGDVLQCLFHQARQLLQGLPRALFLLLFLGRLDLQQL